MKRTAVKILMGALLVSLVGCAGMGPKEQAGTVVGGALGGLGGAQIGSGRGRTAAIIGGTLLGALVGQNVGRSLDRSDEMRAAQALEYNRTGQPTSWHNPDTGADVTVVPERTYRSENDRYCREYTMNIIVGGRREKGYGTACRQPDGSWQTVSQSY
jgi:surface antigen